MSEENVCLSTCENIRRVSNIRLHTEAQTLQFLQSNPGTHHSQYTDRWNVHTYGCINIRSQAESDVGIRPHKHDAEVSPESEHLEQQTASGTPEITLTGSLACQNVLFLAS